MVLMIIEVEVIFQGRITAPLVFAGAICKQILEAKGIKIVSHIKSNWYN